VYAEVHPDSAGRLEDFVQQAEQAERERAQKQEPSKSADVLLALAVSGWVKGKGAGSEQGTTALRLWAAREFVLEYQRTDDTNAHNQMLRRYRQEIALSPEELSRVIALLPPPEPENLNARTGVLVEPTKKVPVPPDVYRRSSAPSANHPRGVEYLIRLPAEYHHGRAYPVVLALTDATAGPGAIMTTLGYEADRHGYILAAPDWSKVGTEWKYRGEDHSYATEVLRDVARHFNVNNDRVFLFGGGSGGNMALDVGCSHPDLFAGVLTMVATPNSFLILHYGRNAQKLPVYAVTGETATPSLVALRRLFETWMPKGYPGILAVYKGRGFEWFGSEVPVMFDWMSRKQRASPKSVLQLDPNNTTPPWQSGRTTDNRFYWLGVGKVSDKRIYDPERSPRATPAQIRGDIRGNHITLDGNGGTQAVVWLSRELVDPTKPVSLSFRGAAPLNVSINGGPPAKWKPQVIEPSLEVLLNDYAERGDRRMLFLQKLEFPTPP
jgi:hypothetical protein